MPSHYGNIPSLQELIERSGVDKSFFEEGGASAFAQQLGLKGKGLEGFSRFADIMKFRPEKIKELLSSIGEFGQEQRGFIQEQFGTGLSSLRSGLKSQLAGARQQTGGFAGFGAQQRSIGLLGESAQRQFGGLKQARTRGLAGVQQQVEARIGQTQGLLGDYISRLTQLGSQFLALDPGDLGMKSEQIPNFTTVPSDYSGDMIMVGTKPYEWDSDTNQYVLSIEGSGVADGAGAGGGEGGTTGY